MCAAGAVLLALASTAHAQATATAPPAASSGHVSSKQLDQTKDQLGKLPKGSDLRPSGAISVTAKRAELVQGSSAVYTGNVVMESDTLRLEGDRLELKQFPNSQYVATLTGGPAHMAHPSSGTDDPPMTARAKTITYDSHSNIADLSATPSSPRASRTFRRNHPLQRRRKRHSRLRGQRGRPRAYRDSAGRRPGRGFCACCIRCAGARVDATGRSTAMSAVRSEAAPGAAAGEKSLLSAHGLVKRYRRRTVVADVR